VKIDEYKKFVAYAAAFFSNMGNYRLTDNRKFIPDMKADVFRTILISHPLYNKKHAFYKEVIDELWPQVKTEIFNNAQPFAQQGYSFMNQTTGLQSCNIDQDED